MLLDVKYFVFLVPVLANGFPFIDNLIYITGTLALKSLVSHTHSLEKKKIPEVKRCTRTCHFRPAGFAVCPVRH